MKSDRRNFIKGLIASSSGTGFFANRSKADEGNQSIVTELAAILESFGYNSSGGNSALLAVISDAHIFLGDQYPQYRTETYDDNLIDEINSLAPFVDELVMAGDLISYHSMAPGLPNYGNHLEISRDEFELAKVQMARFNYRTWMVPGNHDTTAHEQDAEMFREYMEVPAYQKTVLAGVPVFFLNSGNAGMLDRVQETWFRTEAAAIDKNQEVLIVAHIPPMPQVWTQAGVKRIIAEAFKNHKSTVWVMSGHSHAFSETKFVEGNVTYIQTITTSASAIDWAFGDDNNPGYTLLALQEGKVIRRVFRSIRDSCFTIRPPIEQMVSQTLTFMFDDILYPAALYEEGFYEHGNRVVEYDGVHVGSYISRCKSITLKVNPSEYMGAFNTLVISGAIRATEVPVCSMSFSGEIGTWTKVPFPEAKGNGLYEIVIPISFLTGGVFFVKLDTGLTGSLPGFKMSGWALACDVTQLTGYQKWISKTYRTLEIKDETSHTFITAGSRHPNIINFGHNLMPTDDSQISGLPKVGLEKSVELETENIVISFARMTAAANPGISYIVETSEDLIEWESIDENDYQLTIMITDQTWEYVKLKMNGPVRDRQFYRVKLDDV